MSALFIQLTSSSPAEAVAPQTPTSSRWSSEEMTGSPSVVVKNTFIEGFEMPIESQTPPRRARSCPCDRTPRCIPSLGVAFDADEEKRKDGETCSESASTRADEFVVSTPLDTPRSSCTQTSDRTLDSTPTQQSICFEELQPMVVRLFDHVASETSRSQSPPVLIEAASSNALGCASRYVPPPPPAQPAMVHAFRAVHAPPPPPSQAAPGSASLPSVGSAGHASGYCKPCAFLHTKGCSNGVTCSFCHLCQPGERKFRQREKKAMAQRRAIVKARAAMQLLK